MSEQATDAAKIDTHNLIVDFGKHRGERWTRLPISYLKWLVNEATPWAEIAKHELERRGSVISPEVVLSAHAVDRASQRCLKIWEKDRRSKNEGLYSWLHRVSTEALEYGRTTRDWEHITYKGMEFAFTHGEVYPTLKSVCPV